jgi:hypothetical protein
MEKPPEKPVEVKKSVTIAIPTRWQPAAFQIKQFIEKYAASHHQSVGEVILAFQLDSGQVYVLEHSLLNESELLVCQNAVGALSTRLNANLSKDVWQGCQDVMTELEEEARLLDELMKSIGKPL